MAPPGNAGNISRCTVAPVKRDAMPTDHVRAYNLLPSRGIDGRCYSQAFNTVAGMAAIGITFPASGASDDVVAQVQASRTSELSTLAALITVAGDVATNLSQVQSILDAQADAVADQMVRTIFDALYSPAPPPNAPAGLAQGASQNPNGVLTPLRGAGEPITTRDLMCMQEALGVPSTPESPVYFVLPKRLYFQLHELARSQSPAMLGYDRDPASGRTMLRFCGTSVARSDHCPEDLAYLVAMDGDASVPEGTSGVSLVYPRRNELTALGGSGLSVGPITASPNADSFQRLVTFGYGVALGSAGATVGLTSIGY